MRLDFSMESDAHVVQAERLDRAVEQDLTALDGEAAFAHHGGNVAGRHRAVKLTGIAGLAQHDEALPLQLCSDGFGL